MSEELLWKPISESDGNLVILTPRSINGNVGQVGVMLPDGSFVEGRFAGDSHNGNRGHYRFDRPGHAFPAGSQLVIRQRDGGEYTFPVSSPGSRMGGTLEDGQHRMPTTAPGTSQAPLGERQAPTVDSVNPLTIEPNRSFGQQLRSGIDNLPGVRELGDMKGFVGAPTTGALNLLSGEPLTREEKIMFGPAGFVIDPIRENLGIGSDKNPRQRQRDEVRAGLHSYLDSRRSQGDELSGLEYTNHEVSKYAESDDLAHKAIGLVDPIAEVLAVKYGGDRTKYREDLGAILATAIVKGAKSEEDLVRNALRMVRDFKLTADDVRSVLNSLNLDEGRKAAYANSLGKITGQNEFANLKVTPQQSEMTPQQSQEYAESRLGGRTR